MTNPRFDALGNAFDSFAHTSKYIDYFKADQFDTPNYEIGYDSFRVNPAKKIVGFNSSEFKSAEQFYNLVHPEDVDFAINFALAGLDYANKFMLSNFTSLNSELIFRMIGKNNTVRYIKKRSLISGVGTKQVTSNVTYLEDVTWLSPRNVRKWKLTGINAGPFDFNFPEVENFKQILSNREVEILKLLARGLSSSDVANALNISCHTVNTHRRNMLQKTEASNTTELVSILRDLNIEA